LDVDASLQQGEEAGEEWKDGEHRVACRHAVRDAGTDGDEDRDPGYGGMVILHWETPISDCVRPQDFQEDNVSHFSEINRLQTFVRALIIDSANI
jgi:hypothetical protein